MMSRKLFCEISPLTYRIAVQRQILLRKMQDFPHRKTFATQKSHDLLPVLLVHQKSLMRRKLGNVDLQLQENKVVNLSLAAPKVSHVLIHPGETFSFWKLVGSCTEKKGYQTGLVISKGLPSQGIGGGLCQFTNLIHWLVLHTPLKITEHHHHDQMDLFPDYGRQIPFGTGTSIVYNYRDYRFFNPTDQTFQLIVYTDEKYLCGELRCEHPLNVKYHVRIEEEHFTRVKDKVYRRGKVYQVINDVQTGLTIHKNLIKENNALLMYEIDPDKITEEEL